MGEYIRAEGYTEMSPEAFQKIADKMGVPVESVTLMHSAMNGPQCSLNTPVSEEDTTTTRQDLLVSTGMSQEDHLEYLQLNALQTTIVRDALDTLDDRTRDIVKEQLLQPEGERVTLAILGDRYNISKERARQIREAGIKKITKFVQTELQLREFQSGDLFPVD